jgi:CHAT domain-containing protein
VANVDYDAQGAVSPEAAVPSTFGRHAAEIRGLSQFKFPPLWGTRGESAVIEKLYRSKYATGITVLEQSDASKDRFCIEAPRHKFLHIATHGFFAPVPLTSRIDAQLRRSGPATMSDLSPRRQLPAGLLSGLAFAGANAEGRGNEAGGLLLAAEVETLDLRGVELAVLSACETGLGELTGTEGLLGLQRSFQVAGAETVIASLWEIPDDATRSLMEHFYDFRLQKRMGTLAAMREAQLMMLREGRRRGLVRVDRPAIDPAESRVPPFYWGAFVLSGDWR